MGIKVLCSSCIEARNQEGLVVGFLGLVLKTREAGERTDEPRASDLLCCCRTPRDVHGQSSTLAAVVVEFLQMWVSTQGVVGLVNGDGVVDRTEDANVCVGEVISVHPSVCGGIIAIVSLQNVLEVLKVLFKHRSQLSTRARRNFHLVLKQRGGFANGPPSAVCVGEQGREVKVNSKTLETQHVYPARCTDAV